MGCWSLAPDAALLAQTSRFLEGTAFACYKGLCFFYFLACCVVWPLGYDDMYLFLTWWAWYIGAVYFALSFTTACMHMRRRRKALRTAQSLPGDGEGEGEGSAPAPSWSNLTGDAPIPLAPRTHIPRLERVLLVSQLFTWNVACPGSLIVCTVFWATLYGDGTITSVDINAHSFFAFIMIIDQFLVASEFRLRDAWKAEAIGTIYVIFNITYYCLAPQGEKLIYYILDWGRKPLVAVAYSALVLFVLIPVFTALHYGVYRLRESMFASCRKRVETSTLPDVLHDHLLGGAARGGGSTSTSSRRDSVGSREAEAEGETNVVGV